MREKWIDGLKGISICAIIMTHCGLYQLPGKVGLLCSSGQLFVAVFFIISAFLSFRSYSSFQSKSNNSCIWVLRKIILLIPLYYLAIVLGIILGGQPYWLGMQRVVSPLNVLSHITFLSGFFPHYCNSIIGVEWYIGILAIFYVFTPLLYRLLDSSGKTLLAFILTSIALSFFVLFFSRRIPSNDQAIYYSFITQFCFIAQLPALFLGIILFHIKKRDNRDNKECFMLSNSTITALLFLGVILLLGEILGKNHLYRISSNSVLGFAFLCIICFAMTCHTKLIENRLFCFLGEHSYPLYLFHYPLILVYEQEIPNCFNSVWVNLLVKFIIILFLTAVLSFLLNKYIQTPLQKWVGKSLDYPTK